MNKEQYIYDIVAQMSYDGKLDSRISTSKAKQIIELAIDNYPSEFKTDKAGLYLVLDWYRKYFEVNGKLPSNEEIEDQLQRELDANKIADRWLKYPVLGDKHLLTDIHGNKIYQGDKFKFKFLKELHNPIELIGSIIWNHDELRYEIDIHDNDEYVCLSYVSNGAMFDFELI